MRIAFAGRIGSGKTTAVNYLLTKYENSLEIKFAHKLYDICTLIQNFFNFDVEKDRRLLTDIGMWARSKNEDIFVDFERSVINENLDKDLFCSDLRFQNELIMLKKYGFKIIWINRDTIQSNHISENSIFPEDCDFIVDNTNTLELFIKNLDSILDSLIQD